MAGKGFLVRPNPSVPLPPKDRSTGRFIPPSPPQVVDTARSSGREVLTVVSEEQAPEHPTPGGKNHVAEEIPPIKATPPAHKPMKLRP